ncbi:MAG: hypothetical protein Q8R13_06070 [bacterium]|nr:hypothetical protein [bacterium]
MSELIPGSAALSMTNWQCIDLMESAEDTLGAITSSLSYLIHQESQNAKPNTALITEWEALDDEVFTLGNTGLLGADVETYQRVISTYRQRSKELREVVDRYRAAQKRIN